MPATFAVTREEIEVYRFSLPAALGIPLLAVVLQAYLPLHFTWFRIFDLPLLVTIYFGVARRKQVAGLLTGSLAAIAPTGCGPGRTGGGAGYRAGTR